MLSVYQLPLSLDTFSGIHVFRASITCIANAEYENGALVTVASNVNAEPLYINEWRQNFDAHHTGVFIRLFFL